MELKTQKAGEHYDKNTKGVLTKTFNLEINFTDFGGHLIGYTDQSGAIVRQAVYQVPFELYTQDDVVGKSLSLSELSASVSRTGCRHLG